MLMALATHLSRCGVRVRSVTGGTLAEAHTEHAKARQAARAENDLPRRTALRPAPPPGANANETAPGVLCQPEARPPRPCVVSRRHEQARRRRCISAG